MITKKLDNFDLSQIADSGQCFRMLPSGGGTKEYRLIARSRVLTVRRAGEGLFEFDCDESDFDNIWSDYFDLKTDYGAYIASIPESDAYLNAAARFGSGIRILRQDPFETLITFIISQRKNIQSIRSCVENLCKAAGSPLQDGLYDFPTPEKLFFLEPEKLSSCSLGYRDKYVRRACEAVYRGEVDLEHMASLSDEELFSSLTSIYGVGKKVASCIMLFAYHRIAAFPIDVWIQRVLDDHYEGSFPLSAYPGYAGIMQQYLFFYERSRAGKI